jgi:osmotically-inducible protein OsmY
MSSRKNTLAIAFVTVAIAGMVPVYAQTDPTAPDAITAPSSKKVARKQNHQLEGKVRHALTSTQHLDSSGILILARGGKVTLEGDAPDDKQIQVGATTAAKVSGVTGVTNNLHIREAGN